MKNGSLSIRTPKRFRAALRLLRKYAHGFEETDGYNLKHIRQITPSRRKRIYRYYRHLRSELDNRFIHIYKPKTTQNLKIAKKTFPSPPGLGKLKFASILKPSPQYKALPRIRHGKLKVHMDIPLTLGIIRRRRIFEPIDNEEFMFDHIAEAARAAIALQERGATLFTIIFNGVRIRSAGSFDYYMAAASYVFSAYDPSFLAISQISAEGIIE